MYTVTSYKYKIRLFLSHNNFSFGIFIGKNRLIQDRGMVKWAEEEHNSDRALEQELWEFG